MASITDLLLSVGKRGTLTTLKPPGKEVGAESLKIEQSLSWPTDSKVAFSIRRVNVGGENDGREIEGTYTEWTGILNTEDGSIDNLHLEQGNDQDYPPGNGTEVFIHVSVTIWEHLMQALRNIMSMDGKLKKSAVESALGTSIDTRWDETFGNYVVPGTGIVSTVTGTTIATTNIVYYINGIRLTKTDIPNKTLSPSKDTYRYINSEGVITEIVVDNNASAPTKPSGSIPLDVCTTNATVVAGISLMSRQVIDLSKSSDVIRLTFEDPSGSVYPDGVNNVLGYTRVDKSPNSTMRGIVAGSASSRSVVIGVDGWYSITANLRCIDQPKPTVHQISYSVNGGTNWPPLTGWSPHAYVTPENTSRQLQPITMTVPLTAGTMLRHEETHTTGMTRFGALVGSSITRSNTSLIVERIA